MKIGKTAQVEERIFDNNFYVGYDSFVVLAINPTKEELAKIYGTTADRLKDQIYVNESAQVINAKGEETQGREVSIKVYVKCVNQVNGKDFINCIKFKVKEGIFVGQTTGKHQVIDDYGQTAWVTEEEFKSKAIPVFSNGSKANIGKYRHTYRGEAELVAFIRNWLGFPDPIIREGYDPNTKRFASIKWREGEALEACEFSFEIAEWKEIFKGNFKILQDLLKGHEAFQFKGFTGISSKDNQDYQIMSRTTLRNDASTNQIKKVSAELIELSDRYWIEADIKGQKIKVVPKGLTKVTPVPTNESTFNAAENITNIVEDVNTPDNTDDLPFGADLDDEF